MQIEFNKVKEIFGPETERIFMDNIRSLVVNEIGPKFVSVIMEKFDEFVNNFSSAYGKSEEDPTFPGKWREHLEEKLLSEVEQNIIVEGNRITLDLGEKSFLGYDVDSPRSDEPIIWLVYYLEGLAGEYAFIDEQTFIDKKGSNRDISRYGRFGHGFLIHMDDFFREGWNEYVSFEEARFPASVPDDFFETAAGAFSEEMETMMRDSVTKAFIAALQKRKV